MITLFIDTNVLLSFYHLTSEDIEELKKLVVLVENKEINLIVPKQVENEFRRNRGAKISDAMKKLREANFSDCVFAGAAHETMLWNKEADLVVPFSDKSVLSDYSAVTGFDPNDPSTDQGTDMQVAASYRKKTGIRDAKGKRHKIDGYLAIKSPFELKQAVWLFGAAGVGVKFPASAMKQFKAGKPFTVVKSGIDGGHYMPVIGYDKNWIYLVTWGKVVQQATYGWINKYMDESIAYLSLEMLKNGKSLEGFDLITLQRDIAAI